MSDIKKTERHIKNIYANKLQVTTSTNLDQRVLANVTDTLEELKREKSAATQPNIWRIIVKSRITQLAAVVVVVLAVCWLAVSDRGELEQQQNNGRAVAVTPETPAELMSVISLSMVFRDGDMEAMEKQFDKAEKLVRPGLKERITIDQLICELEECKQI